jgi:hypothetical protein
LVADVPGLGRESELERRPFGRDAKISTSSRVPRSSARPSRRRHLSRWLQACRLPVVVDEREDGQTEAASRGTRGLRGAIAA